MSDYTRDREEALICYRNGVFGHTQNREGGRERGVEVGGTESVSENASLTTPRTQGRNCGSVFKKT